MDHLARLSFGIQLRSEFQQRTGEGFQKLFERIMAEVHPGDFVAVTPWGAEGDLKNDGYLRSERRLFQCYAPRELTQRRTLSKMKSDFRGALKHWRVHFDEWVFVHNSLEGLPPRILQELLFLENANPPVLARDWGIQELQRRLFALPLNQVANVLGAPLSYDSFTSIGFADLEIVVTALARAPPPPSASIKPVPAGKLEANSLSSEVADYLKLGMQRSDLVRQFFRTYFDPTLGDRTADAFRKRYGELKQRGLSPDGVFTELRVFAQGAAVREPKHEAAVLAVLSYLFEECDIFERPAAR